MEVIDDWSNQKTRQEKGRGVGIIRDWNKVTIIDDAGVNDSEPSPGHFGRIPFKSQSISNFDFTTSTVDSPQQMAGNKRDLGRRDIQTGDLLFFHGEDVLSKLIETGTASEWSHVGTVVELFSETLSALRDFMKYMPQNWRDVAEEIAKVALMMRKQERRQRVPFSMATFAVEEEGEEEDEDKESPATNNIFGVTSRVRHIAQILVVHMLLRNNKNIKRAIQQECQYREDLLRLRHGLPLNDGVRPGVYYNTTATGGSGTSSAVGYTPRGESKNTTTPCTNSPHRDSLTLQQEEAKLLKGRSREMCLWESTTSTCVSARCVLTGQMEAGVKLTNLDVRAGGYDGLVGHRTVKVSTSLDSIIANLSSSSINSSGCTKKGKEKERVCAVLSTTYTATTKLYFQNQLYALFCNMVVNAGKPYERDYAEMLDAWAHSGFCCSGPGHSGPCRAVGWCLFKLFCCSYCTCASTATEQDRDSPYYHPVSEYSSLYCSELTMQLLYDYLIIMELKNYNHLSTTASTYNNDSYTASLATPRTITDATTTHSSMVNLSSHYHVESFAAAASDSSSVTFAVKPKNILVCHPYEAQVSNPELNPNAGGNNKANKERAPTSVTKSTSSTSFYHVNKDWDSTKLNLFNVIPRQPQPLQVESSLTTSSSAVDVVRICHEFLSALDAEASAVVKEEGDTDGGGGGRKYSMLLGRTEVTPKYLATGDLPIPFVIDKLNMHERFYTFYI